MCKKGIDLLTRQMKGEWPRVPVSDIATAVIGGTPRRSVAEYWDGNLPWATAKDVARVPSRYLDEVQENITEAGLESSTTKLMPAGTVVITARGTVGALAQLRREMAFNQTCYAILPGDSINNNFLFYALKGTIAEMRALTYGTVFDTITRRTFDDWLLPLPPLTEQRVIAHILGTLDDKIELNRRLNETLEEMARAIFKSWFVDFDPVRAKMDGSWRRGESLPGMPAEMYDMFPERLVDSELGEIPEGWEVGTLGTVLQQRIERCRPSLEIEAIPYVPIDCISSKSLFLTTNKSGKEARSSLIRFYQGDLLFGAMRPYYHKVCIAPFNGTTRTTAFVLFPKEPYDFGFSTMLLHAPDTIAYATRHSIGSTIPYAVWTSSLEEMQVILPHEKIRREFNRVVYPLLTKIPSVYFENRTLADLRDTLLPKLISGELRVGDAEKFMESVV